MEFRIAAWAAWALQCDVWQIKLVAQGSRTRNKLSYPSETRFFQLEVIEKCLLIPKILIVVWTGKGREKSDDLYGTDKTHMFLLHV